MDTIKKIGPTTSSIVESFIEELNRVENQNRITHPIKRELSLPFGIIVALLFVIFIINCINLYLVLQHS